MSCLKGIRDEEDDLRQVPCPREMLVRSWYNGGTHQCELDVRSTKNLANLMRDISPSRWIRSLSVAIAAVSLFAIALSCARQDAKTAAPIRIGYLPIYVDLPLFVAKQEGFFDRRGVAVELVRFAQSPDIAVALQNGDVKFGASVAFAVILSNESRDPGKLKVFIVDSENEKDYLSSFVALPASGITKLEDLRGKKIGSFPGPQAMTFCKLVLQSAGLDPEKDVTLVELQSASHLSALESKTVDALFTYEPIATQAVLDLGAVKFLPAAVESRVISPWQAGVWVLTSDFQREHPEEAAAIVSALYDAIDFIRKDPTAAKGALSEFTSIRAEVAEATPTIPFAKLGEVDTVALQRHADILQSNGVTSRRITVTELLAPSSWLSKSP